MLAPSGCLARGKYSPPLSEEEKTEFSQKWLAGVKVSTLCDEYGLTPDGVKKRRERLGLAPRSHVPAHCRPWLASDVKRLRALWQDPAYPTIDDVAAQFEGRTRSAVMDYARGHGLGNRPRKDCWTDPANVERAARMWREGMTGTAIAKEIGHGLTRSAVIGKINRLGLLKIRPKNHKSADQIRRSHREAQRRYRAKNGGGGNYARLAGPVRGQDKPVNLPPASPAHPSLNLTLIEVGPNQCRYMAGDTHLCCGHPTVDASSWCDHHLKVVQW